MDITGMFQYHLTHSGIFLNGLVNINLRFLIAFLHKQNPGIGIQERTVVRLCLDGTITHLLGFLQVFSFLTEIIGIIVEASDIVWLPLQATVVCGEGLLVEPLFVEHVAHDGIEVGHEVAVAVAGNLTHSPAEGIYRLVDFVFLRVGQSAEVVERHVVGVILQCRLAEADDAVVVACLPYILQELYACGGIVGLYLEHTEQGEVDERVGHLLQRHVSGLEFCDVGCGLWHLQHLVEEGEHGDAVAAMILAVGGKQISLKLPGIDKPHVVHAADVYLNPEQYVGKKAIVIGSGFTGLEVAELLASYGNDVRIFELDDEIGKRIEGDGSVKNKSALLEHLEKLNVKMHPSTNTLEITDTEVRAENLETHKAETYSADLVVQALGYRPDKRLAEIFEGTAGKVVSIGDCTGIGNIIGATTDAYEAVWNL